MFSICNVDIRITDNDREQNVAPRPYSNGTLRNYSKRRCRSWTGEFKKRGRRASSIMNDHVPQKV